jgi:nucleolin
MEDRDTKWDNTPAEPSTRLFVGGLAWAATDEDLKEAFAKFGEVVSANVVRYQDTGRSKGFGFVEYSSIEEATKAKDEMNDKEILDRPVKIDFARPRKEREERE